MLYLLRKIITALLQVSESLSIAISTIYIANYTKFNRIATSVLNQFDPIIANPIPAKCAYRV